MVVSYGAKGKPSHWKSSEDDQGNRATGEYQNPHEVHSSLASEKKGILAQWSGLALPERSILHNFIHSHSSALNNTSRMGNVLLVNENISALQYYLRIFKNHCANSLL
jgi:hypothetical protein